MAKKKKVINPDKLKGGWEPEVLKGLKNLQTEFKYGIEYEPNKFKYTIEHTYTPDFKITRADGTEFFIEAKGYWDQNDRAKLRHVMEQNPDLDVRMLFQANSKLHRSSPRRYADYCEKYGIPYAIKEIPKEWFSNN